MAAVTVQSRILWAQVVGLALVQGAISLMWLIYNLYLGDLLRQFGFSALFVTGILIVENILAMVMEPLMGSYSDQAQRWLGSRFPFISVGVILASGLLMATATLVTFGDPASVLRWLLPILLVAWALAMTVFRSPALSLLGRYAYGRGLPRAASVLTVIGAFIGSLGPTAQQFILQLGPPMAFGLASLSLLGAAAVLRSLNPNRQVNAPPTAESSAAAANPSMAKLALVFVAGWGIALGGRLLIQTFPRILATIPGLNVALTMATISLSLAATAIPAGQMATRLGNRRTMVIGVVGLAGLLLVMGWVHQAGVAIGVAIALGAFLSLIRNGTLPFALSMVPPHRAGLGIGMFFSGVALANNLFAAFFKQPDAIAQTTTILIAVVGFGLAGGAIAAAPQPETP